MLILHHLFLRLYQIAQISLGSPLTLPTEDPSEVAVVEPEPPPPSHETKYHLPYHLAYLKKNSLYLSSYFLSMPMSEAMVQIEIHPHLQKNVPSSIEDILYLDDQEYHTYNRI